MKIDWGHALRDSLYFLGWYVVLLLLGLPLIVVAGMAVIWGALQWEGANAADRVKFHGTFAPFKGWTKAESGDMLGTLIGVALAAALVWAVTGVTGLGRGP